jgi:hypothetical protein
MVHSVDLFFPLSYNSHSKFVVSHRDFFRLFTILLQIFFSLIYKMRYAVISALLAAATVSASNIAVTVGANSLLAFSPTNVSASPGDVITFS